jgi:hypothetical protein
MRILDAAGTNPGPGGKPHFKAGMVCSAFCAANKSLLKVICIERDYILCRE